MRAAFTLIELIFVIAVSSILAVGTFKAMSVLYIRSAKAQALTDMSLNSQILLDEIALHLYNRIPNSVIGYDIASGSCAPISDLIAGTNYTILEWLATMDDELLERKYDGFIDMGASDRSANTLSAKNIETGFVDADVNLLFSGAFDAGTEESAQACAGAFGWHGNDSKLSYDITLNNPNEIVISDAIEPEYIYEKYYLTKTAYAVARGADLNPDDIGNCNSGAYVFPEDANFSTTLFLFYEYQPFRGETFCGDRVGTRAGRVSILAEDVSAFEAEYVNETIKISLDMNRSIRGSSAVFISKQKAIF